jgi:ribose transport system permease protein
MLRLPATFAVPRFQSLLALLLMTAALSLTTHTFLTIDNGLNVLRQISVNLCLSIGMTLAIVTGGIDLSVGAVLGLAGAIAAGVLKHGIALPKIGVYLEFTVAGAILAGIGSGDALGAVNGWTITRLRLWTGGFPITGLGAAFDFIGTGRFLGIPMPIWEMSVLAIVATVSCQRTRFGRHLYAVGGSERAARLTGLRVDQIKIAVYATGGALSGVASLIVTARLDSAQPNAGLGYELDSIAAVVIGGTSLSGGRGSVPGTVIGCLIIGVLNNGLFLLDVSPFWQQVIKGCVILLAVSLDRFGDRSRRSG